MSAATGRDIMIALMELGEEIILWNKKYTSRAKIAGRLDEMGLTSHQLEILGFLYNHPEMDTVSAIAAELFISKGSLSLMLSKLQKGGYVQKKAAKGKDDCRKVYISLTEKGKNAAEEFKELILNSASQAFEEMEEEHRVLFYEKVKELKNLFYIGGLKE